MRLVGIIKEPGEMQSDVDFIETFNTTVRVVVQLVIALLLR